MLREAPGRVNHNIRSLHSEEREAVQAFLSVASMDFPYLNSHHDNSKNNEWKMFGFKELNSELLSITLNVNTPI